MALLVAGFITTPPGRSGKELKTLAQNTCIRCEAMKQTDLIGVLKAFHSIALVKLISSITLGSYQSRKMAAMNFGTDSIPMMSISSWHGQLNNSAINF
jgi:hypothetical protein